MRLELQIAFLFVLSLAALGLHYGVPRTQLVDYREGDWYADAYFGGNASGGVADTLTERGLEVRTKVVNRGLDGYCAAIFEKNSPEEPTINLRWCTRVKITAWIEGKDFEYFRLFMRNRIPGLYDGRDETRQCNEVSFKLTDERQVFDFPVERFHVPSWWVESHGKEFEHSIPSFEAVDMVEVSIGSSVKNTNLNLIVESIEFHGHWIPPLVLYRSLLASWLVLGAGVFLQKLIDIRTDLKQSKEREHRLKEMNHSLEFKATELSRLAHHDSLTGLMNRLGILQYADLAKEAVGRGEKVSVCLLDIDDFKKINDTHGHQHGDEILAAMGVLLSETATGMDLFARWGGEEFVAICFGKEEQQALKFAAEIGKMIEFQIGITCSLGVYEVVDPDEEFIEVVDRADKAMYVAKARGKNRAVAWEDLDQTITNAKLKRNGVANQAD